MSEGVILGLIEMLGVTDGVIEGVIDTLGVLDGVGVTEGHENGPVITSQLPPLLLYCQY